MLKIIGYCTVLIGIIIYSLRDYIDLQTYGNYHGEVSILYFFFLLFLLVASIIEIVRFIQKKEKKKSPLFIFIGVFLAFSLILFVKPYNPHLFANYKYVCVWEGSSRGEAAFKLFNAYGRLKLSKNGCFILNWRTIFGPSNYYGDWSLNKDTIMLSYSGKQHKRVGTKLLYNKGELKSLSSIVSFVIE